MAGIGGGLGGSLMLVCCSSLHQKYQNTKHGILHIVRSLLLSWTIHKLHFTSYPLDGCRGKVKHWAQDETWRGNWSLVFTSASSWCHQNSGIIGLECCISIIEQLLHHDCADRVNERFESLPLQFIFLVIRITCKVDHADLMNRYWVIPFSPTHDGMKCTGGFYAVIYSWHWQ